MDVVLWGIKMMKVKDLFPNEQNPRTITEKKFKKLKSQIARVGFHSPPKIDNEGILLGGNQRYRALMDMGAGELEVPVMFPPRKLTKKERDEVIATDNVNDGAWDDNMLANLFAEDDLKLWGVIGLNVFGGSNGKDVDSKQSEKKATPYIKCVCRDDDRESLIEYLEVTVHDRGFVGVSFEVCNG